MDENLIIGPDKRRISAATLHARYLGLEVFVWQKERHGIVGKLESVKISKQDGYDSDGDFDKYDVKVVVGGRKLAINGADKIILVDEGIQFDSYTG